MSDSDEVIHYGGPRVEPDYEPWEMAAIGQQRRDRKAALDTQVGGDHYKDLAIQPMEYSEKNGLSAGEHTAIKYLTRHRSKNGIEDLRKAYHCIALLAELTYGEKI